MSPYTRKSLELVVFDRSKLRGGDDKSDPVHWYWKKNCQSDIFKDKALKDVPSDTQKIYEYIKSLSLDKFKEQDHYLVLGIDHLRYKATDSQIRLAYRNACRLFHPDRFNSKYGLNNSQFVFITKAYEQLSDPVKRLSYDSVDGKIDDEIPSKNFKGNFYQVFGSAFIRNARWSSIDPVPLLGDETTTAEHAKEFYKFWKSFISIREFSMYDEQPIEDGDCREERRYLAKQNKKKRDEFRALEALRIKKLIENCRAVDPRVAGFLKQINENSEKERQEKKRRNQEKKMARRPTYSSIPKQTLSVDVKTDAKAETEKKKFEKEQKKLEKEKLEQEKSKFRKYVENHKYFTTEETAYKKLDNIGKFDSLLRVLKYEELKLFNDSLENFCKDFNSSLGIYNEKIDEISNKGNKRISSHFKMDQISNGETLNIENLKSKDKNEFTYESKIESKIEPKNDIKNDIKNGEIWTKERLNVLHKATKQYPVGTKSRYELVTEYINNHCHTKFVVKQIIHQIKSLVGTQEIKIKTQTMITEKPLVNELNNIKYKENWTQEEHRIFQQAIKTYPIGITDRWEKISKLLPEKSIIQCKERLKYLLDIVKKKKLQEIQN